MTNSKDWDKFYEEKRIKMERAKAFAESLDLTPLYEKINEFVGAELTYTSEIEEDSYNSSYRITFESSDVRDHCGIFGKILKECVVDNFGTGISIDEKSGNLYYWVSVHISYSHKDGGMNGMKLFNAWYDETNGWSFRM